MYVVYLNDKWPSRVQTYLPDFTPITADDANVTIRRLDDNVVVLPLTSVAPGGIFDGYVEYIVSPPITSTKGNYVIDWDVLVDGVSLSHRQTLQIIAIPEYSLSEQRLIDALKIRLRDNNPALYRVDEQEEKWHEEELYSFLYYGLADFNGQAPFWTDYTFATLPLQLHGMVLLVAQIYALVSEATLQAANDFAYNDNGLTVTLSRSGKYMAIVGQLWNMYVQMVSRVKRYLGFSLTEWVGVKTMRMPISCRRPLSMLPHLESIFGREGGT